MSFFHGNDQAGSFRGRDGKALMCFCKSGLESFLFDYFVLLLFNILRACTYVVVCIEP